MVAQDVGSCHEVSVVMLGVLEKAFVASEASQDVLWALTAARGEQDWAVASSHLRS